MSNREGLLDKVRALLAKTTENGCTEEEHLAAFAKARAMIDAYEIDDAELALTKDEKAILRKEPKGTRDPHGIKSGLALAVAKFTDCRVWRTGQALTFCGLQSDANFATWLLDHLTAFVQGELTRYLIGDVSLDYSNRRRVINGFVSGCTSRISERLNALCQASTPVTSNARALVVVKGQAVAEKMREMGIHLGKPHRSARHVDAGAHDAGRAAGERASFGRPVEGKGAVLRLRG